MTGRTLLASLVAIVVSTAVLPPAAAWAVNRRRVSRASTDVAALSLRLQGRDADLRRLAVASAVLFGPGAMPVADSAAAQPWVSSPRARLSLVVGDDGLAADPWGNCYVVNVAALAAPARATLWLLSAGPNGIIETPFSSASGVPGGDDVGMVVR